MKRFMLALAALTLVSACGIQGDLERPDPIWNRDERRPLRATPKRRRPIRWITSLIAAAISAARM